MILILKVRSFLSTQIIHNVMPRKSNYILKNLQSLCVYHYIDVSKEELNHVK